MITRVNCHSSFRFPPQHTLSPRGVCSRIPHPGVCPPQHVPFSVHVYVYIIPYLVTFELSPAGVDRRRSLCPTRNERLLDDLAEEREDKQGENRAPDERVEDHQHPPQHTTRRSPQRARHGIPGLTKETLEYQEDVILLSFLLIPHLCRYYTTFGNL